MLFTQAHVMNTETRLQKLLANAYALASKNIWWQKVMSERPGDGKRQDIEFLLTTADIYRLNSKGDGIQYDDMITQAHSVTHEDFGAGLTITKNQFDDESFGFAGDWMLQMGARMAMDPQYEAIRMMLQGEVLKGYDGQPFYSKLHKVHPLDASKGTYDTLITDMNAIDSGLPSVTLPTLTVTNLASADAYIRSLTMPNGKNRNLAPAILRHGPLLKKAALEITSASFIGATDNVMTKYAIEPLVVNELPGYDWYLDCTVGETPDLLPFVRFNRRAYEMTSYNGMTTAELGRRNELEWQVRGRYGYMYGHPYQSYKFKGGLKP